MSFPNPKDVAITGSFVTYIAGDQNNIQNATQGAKHFIH